MPPPQNPKETQIITHTHTHTYLEMTPIPGPIHHTPILQPINRPHMMCIRRGTPILKQFLLHHRRTKILLHLQSDELRHRLTIRAGISWVRHGFLFGVWHTLIIPRCPGVLSRVGDEQVGLFGEFGVERGGEEAVVPPGVDLVLDVEDGFVVLYFVCVCVCVCVRVYVSE